MPADRCSAIEPFANAARFVDTIAGRTRPVTMGLNTPQENEYEEQVRQQRLKVKAAQEHFLPQAFIDSLKPKHLPRPEKITKKPSQQQPVQPPRRSDRNKGKAVVYADLDPAPMATEPSASVDETPKPPPSPTSAVVAVLKANCSDWGSDDEVRSVAVQLRGHKITAGQITQRLITEQDLVEMKFAIGDRKRILPPE